MNADQYTVGYLLFDKVQIQDANSISSPITFGFPAITGFLGSFHAMSRKIMADNSLPNIQLGGVLLACHDCQPQVYRENQYRDYSFNQSRNPIKRDGTTASIIEEGKCHLIMTFVVEVLSDKCLSNDTVNGLIQKTTQWIQQQRMAGGSVHGMGKSDPVRYLDFEDIDTVIPMLMPAFVLMDARETFANIIRHHQSIHPNATALDALIEICTLHHIPEPHKNGEVKWITQSAKAGHGWLVPMPIGYQGISPVYKAGVMQHVRNPEYPSQYVEAIYGLGKWIYPHHLTSNHDINHAFWRYHHDDENNLYLVTQDTIS